jgi:hypothetical protein
MAETAGRERPIPFSDEMVRVILAGDKTQTRRVVKPQPPGEVRWDPRAGLFVLEGATLGVYRRCPYGVPGDRLYVKQTWALPPGYDPELHGDLKTEPRIGPVCFRADYSIWDPWPGTRWRSGRFMPKWAARIWLEVTDVRVERLQEITQADVLAEGMNPDWSDLAWYGFRDLWDSLNAKRGHPWEANDWVWVIEFAAVEDR